MKTLIVRNDIDGTSTGVNAKKTYEKSMGQWVAELDKTEFRRACRVFCRGINDCSCEDMHGQADLDDDGKEYRMMSV
jgi:hypothetical protein